MISCGMRELIRFLCEHQYVDAIVTTCGGIEEDIIKCQNPSFIGEFVNDDVELRRNGINRIGNMYIPNKNYCHFEDFFLKIYDDLRIR